MGGGIGGNRQMCGNIARVRASYVVGQVVGWLL